ncbi:MAG: L-seryl-tRNA(Ser) seleniumtransferase [Planctomycetota bacterium]
MSARVAEELGAGVVPVVNATGVVLNTGLGRAPVHAEAAEAMALAARSYCVLEVDRRSGKRNQRDDRLSELLVRLTGAEAGIAVNNNAAAVVLCLQTFAGGNRETILSRGELVEIGGSFRMPDVMERAGTRLREVGTTNRTRASDYEKAITDQTGLLLKVHTSNFRVEGFTEELDTAGLAELGKRHNITAIYDLGAGLLECAGAQPLSFLPDEPLVRDSVESGLDAVSFSGDKLLGGPQAGLIVGKRDAIRALRSNPMYRALRLDKVGLAGLEKTLELHLAGRADEVPSRAMMLRTEADVRTQADDLAKKLNAMDGITATVAADQSQPGSGSAPGVFLPTFAIRVVHAKIKVDRLSALLRRGTPSVFCRIKDGAALLDPRTLLPGDGKRLLQAFEALS